MCVYCVQGDEPNMVFRVMVATVDKSTTDLKLHFFNNCFDVWFGEEKLKLNKSKCCIHTSDTTAADVCFLVAGSGGMEGG